MSVFDNGPHPKCAGRLPTPISAITLQPRIPKAAMCCRLLLPEHIETLDRHHLYR